jgi:hypothetical protein
LSKEIYCVCLKNRFPFATSVSDVQWRTIEYHNGQAQKHCQLFKPTSAIDSMQEAFSNEVIKKDLLSVV